MVGLCKQLFDRGLAEREQRERELKSFSSSQDEVETHYKNQAIQVLEDFNRQHKEAREQELLCKMKKKVFFSKKEYGTTNQYFLLSSFRGLKSWSN